MRVDRWSRPALALLAAAALNALVATVAGAFGAHVLEGRLDAHHLDIWQTAARYHMYHALGMGLCSVVGASRAGWVMQAGVAVFAGSLYALALSGVDVLGAITPFGGVAFIAGWIAFVFGIMRIGP